MVEVAVVAVAVVAVVVSSASVVRLCEFRLTLPSQFLLYVFGKLGDANFF